MFLYSQGSKYHLTVHRNRKKKPYLLMLHGFMGSSAVFEPLVAHLSPFCNPVTLDLAGHGRTETPAEPDFFETGRQVIQLQSAAERLSLPSLFLYGYSMGGRLAFQLAVRAPELFSGAVIESAHCGLNAGAEKEKRKKLDEERARSLEKNPHGFINRWMNLSIFEKSTPGSKKNYIEIMKKQDPGRMAASLRGFGAGVMPSVCKDLEELSLPLYLVAGIHDEKYARLVPEISRKNSRIRYAIVPGAGHRVHADQPGLLTEILKTFIQNRS